MTPEEHVVWISSPASRDALRAACRERLSLPADRPFDLRDPAGAFVELVPPNPVPGPPAIEWSELERSLGAAPGATDRPAPSSSSIGAERSVLRHDLTTVQSILWRSASVAGDRFREEARTLARSRLARSDARAIEIRGSAGELLDRIDGCADRGDEVDHGPATPSLDASMGSGRDGDGSAKAPPAALDGIEG